MTAALRTGLLLLVSLWIVSMVTAACQSQPTPEGATSQVVSGRAPNASIFGAVTYREGLALSTDASLVVELRDVSFAAAAAPLIASQTISTPGQVPTQRRGRFPSTSESNATARTFAPGTHTPSAQE